MYEIIAIGLPGGFELAIIGFVVVLILGRRGPAIISTAAKSLVGFKKGLKDK